MTKRLTGFMAAVAVIFGCSVMTLNVGCNTEVDNTAVKSGEDVSADSSDPANEKTNATAPPPPPPPGGGN